MSIRSLIEEFNRRYNQPQINGMTVGFSGIDPARKEADTSSDLSEAQQQIVMNEIREFIENLLIQIDAGNVDPSAEEPEVIPYNLEPRDIDHERLGDLLGGSDDGHYHLTQEELAKLRHYPAVADIMGSINSDHERLTNLKGGNSNGHYHLTSEEKTKLLQIISQLIDASTGEIVIPSNIVTEILSRVTSDHEQLANLKGGNSNGHYHLTSEEKNNLLLLISALIDSSSGAINLPSDVEDKLTRERWTFVLEDESSYTRDVALWT